MNKEKKELYMLLEKYGIDICDIISESFLAYKYRKKINKLYEQDAIIPTKLIKMYYNLNPDEVTFNKMKSAFVKHYILNESKLEGANLKEIHGNEEKEGLKAMYEYMHSDDIEYLFDVYTLKDLNKKLFSCAPYPECAGEFRNYDVYLPGTGTELCEWREIRKKLNELNPEILNLKKLSSQIKKQLDADELLNYLNKCVELKCKLIKIHPFGDGNGRTIRCFINKLLEDAGLPPVYIEEKERTEYHVAMNKANNENDYKFIKSFYKYKICDSIIELDINDRINEKSKQKTLKK